MLLLAFGDNKWQKDFAQVFAIECICKWTLSRGVHQINWLIADEVNGMEKMQKHRSTKHI
jgi:hypothetical protein